MKKFFLLLLTICSVSLSKATTSLTAQIPDKITYEGTEYNLNANPLEPFFDKYPDKRPQSGMVSSALWRGYVAYFEVIDAQLYVTDIKIEVPSGNKEDSYPYTWVSAYKEVFPNEEKVKIDWYTGILILPDGELVEYVHMGYSSMYSEYWLLEIEEGNFNEARNYKHTEFVAFKKRQLKEFKKTEAYKTLYAELLDNDSSLDKNHLESFLEDYIINYTSTFLTD